MKSGWCPCNKNLRHPRSGNRRSGSSAEVHSQVVNSAKAWVTRRLKKLGTINSFVLGSGQLLFLRV